MAVEKNRRNTNKTVNEQQVLAQKHSVIHLLVSIMNMNLYVQM